MINEQQLENESISACILDSDAVPTMLDTNRNYNLWQWLAGVAKVTL